MGGAASFQRLSPEEKAIRETAERFRHKVAVEVQLNRRKSEAHQSRLSSDGHLGVNARVSEAMEASRSSVELGEGGEIQEQRSSMTAEKPKLKSLRTVGHLETVGDVDGDHALEQEGDISLSIKGKVGCEDDKVVIKNDGKATFLRTRRVHKNKKGAKKAFVNRKLTNLERAGSDEDLLSDGSNDGLDDAEKGVVIKALKGHFLSSALNSEEHEQLVRQVARVELTDADVVCTKGERGDECYILISGICAVEGKAGEHIAKLSAGSMFCELAMLYDVPRTATIVCASARVVLCKIAGQSFRRCLARFKERTLSETMGFLNHHEIFSKLTLEEKRLFASALSHQLFEPGAKLIDENISTSADWMYLVQEGTVEVTDQYKNRQVLGSGSTFSGQRILYGTKAVAAKALTKLRVMAIGHQTMDRLFGNISEVLRVAMVRHFLTSWKLFRELTDRQQHIVAGLFQQQHFKRGEVIVTAGADPQLALVLDGEVSVSDPQVAAVGALAAASPQPAAEVELRQMDSAPEIELPHAGSLRRKEAQAASPGPLDLCAAPEHETRKLRRGEFYGESTFRENSKMEHSLVAQTDCLVCRAGHDEVCRSLRGCAEKTLPMRLIVQRNRVKEQLQRLFPFSALYEERLDIVVEGFESVEYAANECIQSRGSNARRFCLIVEGEAVLQRGETLEPLPRWSSFGASELLLDKTSDCEVRAAAAGCTVHCVGTQRFMEACGVLFSELARKMRYKDLQIRKADVVQMDLLGEGQFGVVKRVGVRGLFGEFFAMKRMSKRKIIEDEQQGPIQLEREILADCCHPLIVRLVTTFQDDHSVYILMEELSGGDLFTAIRNIGVLKEEHTLFFSASIVLAIEYLHSRGVIYRDLKPENVMLTGDGFVKMVDMGCCSKKVRTYTFVGTPEYLAPEVVLGHGYGQPVDWWSVGVIIYEMACGPLPFGEGCGDPLEVMREVLEKDIVVPPRVGADASDLIASLLERSPEQRLGASTTKGGKEVREHQFFDMLNWDAILGMTIQPPYVPCAPDEGHNVRRFGSMPQDVYTSENQLLPPTKEPTRRWSSNADMPVRGDSAPALQEDVEALPEDTWESEEVTQPPDEGADVSCFVGF